jgi:hypothetical protein
MESLKLVRSVAPRKEQRLVIYNIEGRKGSVQFLSTLFGGNQNDQGNPPETLTLTGTFAAPPRKETPEERKARLAAITPEQKLAAMEAKLAKMRAKIAATPTAAAPAPKNESTKHVAQKAKK